MKHTLRKFPFKEDLEYLEVFKSELEPMKWADKWTDTVLGEKVIRYAHSIDFKEMIEIFYNPS